MPMTANADHGPFEHFMHLNARGHKHKHFGRATSGHIMSQPAHEEFNFNSLPVHTFEGNHFQNYDHQLKHWEPSSIHRRSAPVQSTTQGVHITNQDVINFAKLLITNQAANADFVKSMNTNQMIYGYMKELDPTIKPQGQITSKEIEKCVELLASNQQAQSNVISSVDHSQDLALFLQAFQSRYAGLTARGMGTWDDVTDYLNLQRRRDRLVHLKRALLVDEVY